MTLNYQMPKTVQRDYQKLTYLLNSTIDFPSHKKDWEKSELNNKSIALNVWYVPYKTEKIRHEYKSKSNTSRENQVFLSMITHGKNGIILK